MSTDLQRGRLASMMDEKIRAMRRRAPTTADITWRDATMIRELREALEFYADVTHYQRLPSATPTCSLVDSDNGKIARQALGKK